MSDPRSELRTILTPVAATKDNGVTAATIGIIFEGGPETYMQVLTTYDCCLSIGRHREDESGREKRIQDIPIRYDVRIPLHVSARDKTGITATLLLDKVRRSIISNIEANAGDIDYTWTLERDDATNTRMGGFDPLWQDSYQVYMRPLQS